MRVATRISRSHLLVVLRSSAWVSVTIRINLSQKGLTWPLEPSCHAKTQRVM